MRETEAPPTEHTDEQLLVLVAGGDPAALAGLYDRYGDLVYSFLMRMLGDPSAAGEVLQATFVRVWEHAPRLQGEDLGVDRRILEVAQALGSLEARRLRERRASAEDPAPGESGQTLNVLPTLRAANEPARWMGTRGRIREALHSLPQDQRRTMELCYFHGYRQEEIARLMGEPPATVKGRLRMGMHRLCAVLERDTQPVER